MEISFENNKNCNYLKDLIVNTGDRKAITQFSKVFGKPLIKPTIKRFQKLKAAENADVYNKNESENNKIQKIEALSENNPLILKVRIQDAYRKFFYYVVDNQMNYCKTKDWVGQFRNIEHICIKEISNHDYRKI